MTRSHGAYDHVLVVWIRRPSATVPETTVYETGLTNQNSPSQTVPNHT
jgi:hypothetical protein